MAIRVIQWATGGVGRAAIEAVQRHPELELVGCRVYSADKSGRDVGELIGGEPIGVVATDSREEVLALDADCVVYAPLVADDADVAALLRSGKDVVTPVGWVYPDRSSARVAPLEQACQEGGSTLHGSGIHPGGITERFPLTVSALSAAVTHVRAEEFSDIRTYGAPEVIRDIMGFGGPPEEAMAGPMLALLGEGFKASVRMVVDEMGFAAEPRLRSSQEVAVATAPIDSPIGVIEPGLVAARRFVWEAVVDGVPVVTAAVNWLMGEEHLEPAWAFGPAGERFEVEVQGDPSVSLVFHGLQPESIAAGLVRNDGVVATANHCVSAIPYVHRADPGIKTYLDLPLIAGRAAPGLAR
jgi:2,4-diaminopentanoate dehydrogenase